MNLILPDGLPLRLARLDPARATAYLDAMDESTLRGFLRSWP